MCEGWSSSLLSGSDKYTWSYQPSDTTLAVGDDDLEEDEDSDDDLDEDDKIKTDEVFNSESESVSQFSRWTGPSL